MMKLGEHYYNLALFAIIHLNATQLTLQDANSSAFVVDITPDEHDTIARWLQEHTYRS